MSAVFVDTNVLVYRYDSSDREKQRVAEEWLSRLWNARSGRISIQILQELYVTLTRKVSKRMAPADARRIVRSLEAWDPIPMDVALVHEAWQIEDRYRLSLWDGLVIAAALRTGSTFLLTEDLQDGLTIGALRVVDPFSRDSSADLIHDS